MTAIAFTEAALLNVKRGLRGSFPERKSAHLTEGLAAACGYRTHAALLDALAKSNPSDPDVILLDDEALMRRLYELEGEPIPNDEDFEWFEFIGYPDESAVIKTRTAGWYELEYKTTRQRAWRNLMVSAINVGIERRLFTLRPGDNRWPAEIKDGRRESFSYRFEVAGVPAIASVSDAGWDELNIHSAMWPTPDADRWIGVGLARFLPGEAVASGWLERRDGAWLQYNGRPELHCRAALVKQVADLVVPARGYADRGDFRM